MRKSDEYRSQLKKKEERKKAKAKDEPGVTTKSKKKKKAEASSKHDRAPGIVQVTRLYVPDL